MAAVVRALLIATFIPAISPAINADGLDPAKLPGLVIDDSQATLVGTWKKSTHTPPYVKEGYVFAVGGEQTASFPFQVKESGKYRVLFSYSHGTNRCPETPVTVHHQDGEKTITIDERKPAVGLYCFHDLGEFSFEAQKAAQVITTTKGTNGSLIADAVMIVKADALKVAQADAKKNPLIAKAPAKKPTKKVPPRPIVRPKFKQLPPQRKVVKITPTQLDKMFEKRVEGSADAELIDDEGFLCRATLDIVGRQPTITELTTFAADKSPTKRAAAVDRLLALPEYGQNWANYWTDVIAARQLEPQLTFHNYQPFKKWMASEFNRNASWDSVVFDMLTAYGKVSDQPQVTFIGFHQANSHRVAGETARVFLATNIACAECHDHPFYDMPTETFHGMAAFFTRTEAKIPQLDSNGIEVKSKTKGEHKIPDKPGDMKPVAFNTKPLDLGTDDLTRRAALANWIIDGDNILFSRAYTNRIWERLIGRGFIEPVDDLTEDPDSPLPDVHKAIADHFVATGYDHQELLRLITSTHTYQRKLQNIPGNAKIPFITARTKKLRGDEVFSSLVVAVDLPNVTPPRAKKTGAVRFPPPPKSTRDLVQDAFGYDPSFPDSRIIRTMKQAMFLMNNEQIQRQIDASPKSESFLSKLLVAEQDDQLAVLKLYHAVLARSPSQKEREIVARHLAKTNDRGAAFEDLLWSLINSAEFTTRR